MATLKPYAFLIHPRQAAALKKLKVKTGAPEGESIRRALDSYLKRMGVLTGLPRRRRK
jgi:hypothetical protein